MPYVVMMDDNFHYMDQDERYKLGEFADAGAAIGHCRRIVDEYLESAYKPGMSAAQLYESYVLYGEDPFIQSVDVPQVPFSARDYAQERCQALCAGQSPPQAPPAADPSAGGAN